MIVTDLMIQNVETCTPQDNLVIAAGKMWDRDIGCLPVVNPEGRVVGMITDRDISMAAYLQGKSLAEIPVETVMSKEVFSTAPDASITEAEVTMRVHKVRRLPVVNSEGRLVGIVSLNDLAREAEREVGRKVRDVSSQEVMGTLAAVGEPRITQIQTR